MHQLTTLNMNTFPEFVIDIVARRLAWLTKPALSMICMARGITSPEFEDVYCYLAKKGMLERRVQNVPTEIIYPSFKSPAHMTSEFVDRVAEHLSHLAHAPAQPTEVVRATPLAAGLWGTDLAHDLDYSAWVTQQRLIAAYVHHATVQAEAISTWQVDRHSARRGPVLIVTLDQPMHGHRIICVPKELKQSQLEVTLGRLQRSGCCYEVW